MNIANDHAVTFYYQLSEQDGTPLEGNNGEMPMTYLHGHHNLLPALEEALTGLTTGSSVQVVLSPEQAYGPIKPNSVQRVPIKHLASRPKNLRQGAVVRVQTENGAVSGRVVKAGKFVVDVDLNHPFAGKTLIFDIRIESVREATAEELAHGHAHGVGGHQH